MVGSYVPRIATSIRGDVFCSTVFMPGEHHSPSGGSCIPAGLVVDMVQEPATHQPPKLFFCRDCPDSFAGPGINPGMEPYTVVYESDQRLVQYAPRIGRY